MLDGFHACPLGIHSIILLWGRAAAAETREGANGPFENNDAAYDYELGNCYDLMDKRHQRDFMGSPFWTVLDWMVRQHIPSSSSSNQQ